MKIKNENKEYNNETRTITIEFNERICSNITKGFNYNIQVVQYSDILKLNLTKVSLTKKLTNQEHIKIAEQLLKTYSGLAKEDPSWYYRNSQVEKNDIKTLVSLIDTSIEYNVHTRK